MVPGKDRTSLMVPWKDRISLVVPGKGRISLMVPGKDRISLAHSSLADLDSDKTQISLGHFPVRYLL